MKNKVVRRIEVYSILFIIVLIDAFIEHQNTNSPCFFIGIVGVTSAMYAILYIGLKIASTKLNKVSRLRKTIEKMHISGKELSLHICIVIVSIMIIHSNSSNAIVKEGTAEKEVLIRIEKEVGRNDINSVLKIDDQHIVITFSDNSRKIITEENLK